MGWIAAPDIRDGAGFDTRLMARWLAALFAAGATLVGLTIGLGHDGAYVPGMIVVIVNAYLISGALVAWSDRLPPWTLQAGVAIGSVHITAVAHFENGSPSPLIAFYLWVFLYSAYFFSLRQTAVQVAFVGALYALLLVADPPDAGAGAWWLVEMGTLVVGALMVGLLRMRVDELIRRLFEAARSDPLTGLLNRRGFRELLDLELERARRSDVRTTVVVGDLDHFKQVNDRSGHHAGDLALQRLAAILEHGKRRIDIAARAGGEEFALILPDTDQMGGLVVAERIREQVRREFANDPVPLTISFGVASYPEHGETPGALLRAADQALYAAKESGRDRTVLHSAALRELSSGAGRDVAAERYAAVMLDLAEVVDLRFSGSARHSETVGRYAEMMARELGFPEPQVQRIRLAGILHDIGKVAVPDAILRKAGALTDEEWTVIRQHPSLGAEMLDHPQLADVRGWVASHHERPDGLGYPAGLKGDEIALEARIIAVADAYEAMTSDRAYRSSIGLAQARDELVRCRGTQFDVAVVDAFLTVLARDETQARQGATL